VKNIKIKLENNLLTAASAFFRGEPITGLSRHSDSLPGAAPPVVAREVVAAVVVVAAAVALFPAVAVQVVFVADPAANATENEGRYNTEEARGKQGCIPKN